ncbi:MAG: hypothetical protein HFH32_02345 [Eubacterium sp.]|jgi:uncharacterized membrane protein YkoI|nr:hypothetical protein [Eubacterium sp.]
MNLTKNLKAALFTACFTAAGILAWTQGAYAASISSESQAGAKALEKVPGATITDTDRDYEKGTLVYDVQLVKGNRKYEITYRASDAKILEYSWEKISVSPSSSKPVISESKCKSLAKARVKNGTIVSIARKFDDGLDYYKVKMTDSKKTYILEFHARTGALIEYEWKYTASSGNAANSSGDIGLEKAKQIALEKVPGGTVVKAESDYDDGVPVYEIEIVKGRMEYEYTIHARTGQILDWDQDYD